MSAGRLPGAWGQIMVTVGGERKLTVLARVSERFFDAVGLAIVEGRPLQSGDQRWNGVVVNHTFASTHWPNRSALGQVVGYQATALQAVVVGVVRDGLAGLTREPDPRVYELFAAEAGGRSPARDRSISYIVRASGEPLAYRESIRRAIARDGSQAVLGEISTLGSRLSDAVRDRTFATLVLSLFGFAGAAVTLAGLVGIVTFVVARRTRELAIRLAIGASTAHVRGLVAREAVAAALAGGFAGLVAGRWLSTWLEHLVYGIEAGNWTTTSAAGAAMLTLMIAAALIPARRAMRLQPTDALRVE
jgi:hypothetical protein